jgi:hypothetical protein
MMEAQAVVLTHFWVISMAVSSWTEMALARSVAATDVLVFCYGLPEDQRRRWVETIRDNSPEKILLQMDDIDSGPVGGMDAMVALGSGPGALVSTIYGLLIERGMPSKGWKSLETTLLDDVSGGPIQ